jgi:hypothetical protein
MAEATSGDLTIRLQTVWNDSSVPYGLRRERLFELWDELRDGRDGTRAKEVVVDFIQANVPEGSSVGYTAEELERLNARRRSAEPFDPYQADLAPARVRPLSPLPLPPSATKGIDDGPVHEPESL